MRGTIASDRLQVLATGELPFMSNLNAQLEEDLLMAELISLPLALIVVILGGTGSLLGALVGSFLIGFLYNFGQAMLPELAYVVLFLPMLVVLVVRPQGLFGRPAT